MKVEHASAHLTWVDHGPCFGLGLLGKYGARCGWGWDQDLPLRPWPAMHRGQTPKGRHDLAFAWCGFYVAATWGSTSDNGG